MKYPLLVMMLKKKECKHIMQTIVKFGLTKAGISSNLRKNVRYGPPCIVIIILLGPSLIQGAGQIYFLVKH